MLVVGSGPAGLAAALTAGRSGARVVLVEQDYELGGQLLSERTAELEVWRQAQLAELTSLSNVKIRARTTAQGLYDDNFVVLLQRHEDSDAAKGKPRQTLISLRAKYHHHRDGLSNASGVFEQRPPGVMLASAVRTYLNRSPWRRASERWSSPTMTLLT